jgi:hypothetical protein
MHERVTLGRAGLGLLVLLVGTAVPATAQKFDKLGFMAGCWEGKMPDGSVVEEWWMPPSDNVTLALTRYLKKGRTTSWEFTSVEQTDSQTVFVAQTKQEKPDTFRLKALSDEAVFWERGGTDYPNRIIYRLTADRDLIARLESDEDPAQKDFELRMVRAKCPNQ